MNLFKPFRILTDSWKAALSLGTINEGVANPDTYEWRAQASVLQNEKFIIIETYSVRGSAVFDPEGISTQIASYSSDKALGEALLKASDIGLGEAVLKSLNASRLLGDLAAKELMHFRRVAERYNIWVASVMKANGYKTKKALFQNMKKCNITRHKNVIVIRPWIHEKLEGWGREKNDGIEDVFIWANAPAVEIGAAVREAFSRCR